MCSASSSVEESSNKLEVLQFQLKLMLKTPRHWLIAVLWEKKNSPSLVDVRAVTGRYFSYTSVLSAFRYVPHSLQGRGVLLSPWSLYIALCMLGNPFSWSSPFGLFCSGRPEEERIFCSDAPCVKLLQNYCYIKPSEIQFTLEALVSRQRQAYLVIYYFICTV